MALNNTYTISAPTITIDNIVLPIVPNTFMYTEGLGEQDVRAQSAGGGSVSPVISLNVETCITDLRFSVENTQANIEFIRALKVKNRTSPSVISFFDNRVNFIRTVQQAVITNNYEVALGSSTQIAVEGKGSPAV